VPSLAWSPLNMNAGMRRCEGEEGSPVEMTSEMVCPRMIGPPTYGVFVEL